MTLTLTEKKYFKPKSLTWLASLVPLGCGVFLAAEPLHNLTTWVEAVTTATGGMSPFALINAGLIGIGLRGAVGQ
ncbi:hypothetical protein MHM88_14290 [Epibacterium sp. MM17-32]|uniref:hypothetical protein n=1 Tax=Epibacterium sp. MM17-32 TaxID=2917734 RepID=UPI001EF69A50|nr:hypothetical protein [Epibacterium sp. MM17-32]MCG7628977.1 hypothetical protein [Epibacterium sp. MM17-32]